MKGPPGASKLRGSDLIARSGGKLGFDATWTMAVGGMVGGGIFSNLGVEDRRFG